MRVLTSSEAVGLIKDGDSVGVQGIICTSVAEELIQALAKRYQETQSPQGIHLFYESGIGDNADGGMNALAIEGLVGELFCGHLGTSPKMAALVTANAFPAFIVPQGVNAQLVRATAGRKPGVITSVGLGTFADPRIEGCFGNQAARDSGKKVVEVVNFDGEEYLRYLPLTFNVCFIRATSADEAGNLSIEKESIQFDQFEMATATHNCGGIVIAQVERIVERASLNPKDVVIPGLLVDYVVVADPINQRQCIADDFYHPEWSGETRMPLSAIKPARLDERKVMGRRASFLLKEGYHVNLGIGVPEKVSDVAAEEGVSDKIAMSIEAGIFGGVPLGGLRITSAINPECIISHVSTFDIYDGGGVDLAVLGSAEVDQYGNVNVSKFNGRAVGPGGFVNISSGSKIVAFVGAFTAGGSEYEIGGGLVTVKQEGRHIKYKSKVEQITFSGEVAAKSGKEVYYISERAVFRLTRDGLELIEVAPGIDLEKDILRLMEFKPLISSSLKQMDPRIFTDSPMGLTL